MQLKVYNGEKHERGQWWYILFGLFFVLFILLTLWNKNLVGAILLFILLGGYFLLMVTTSQVVTMAIEDTGLRIDKKIYPWSSISGFVLEMHKETEQLHNVVLLIGKRQLIHTLADSPENIKAFILALADQIPMADAYEQSFLEKLTRGLRL